MAKKKSGAKSQAWRKWHDPNATEEDYLRWRTEHQKRVRERVDQLLLQTLGNSPDASSLAAAAGLSSTTVRRYANRKGGTRGPLMTTYIALRLRQRS